ncbi:AbrB family transcriptional regulator [Sphingomonas sp. Leaf412]|nr:AbrB family transcriptional regulator [Sphingomonas sp. Leaf412]
MMDEQRLRTFKSGNSVALRLPKAMGVVEGEEMKIVPHADGSFSLWRVADDKAVFMALPGQLSAGFIAGTRGDIEQPERDWSRGDGTAAAA